MCAGPRIDERAIPRTPWASSGVCSARLADAGRLRSYALLPHVRNPRRALPGPNVAQMHYARQGIITPRDGILAHPRDMKLQGGA